MKFLLDQDVYAATAGFIKSLGHDVITTGEIGFPQAPDYELLKKAEEKDRMRKN